jgi:WD40 repeat protein
MRFLLSCLLLLGVLLPARAQDDAPPVEPADEGDANARAVLAFNAGHHVGPINALLFTPDGKRLISAGEDRTVQEWDAETGERLRVFRLPASRSRGGAVLAAALSPDGKTLVCGAAGVTFDGGKTTTNVLYLLNLDDGRILPLQMPGGNVVAVAISPDGDRLAAGHFNAHVIHVYEGLKDVWNHTSSPPRRWRRLQTEGTVPRLAFSPDGSRLAVSTIVPATIRIWDLTAPETAPATQCGDKIPAPLCLAWAPDGQRLLSGHRVPRPKKGMVLNVWSAAGKHLKSFTPEALGLTTPPREWYHVHQILFRGKDQVLLLHQARHEGRSAVLLDLESGHAQPVISLADGFGYTEAGALSPDGRRAALPAAPEGRRIALVDVQADAKPRYLAGEGLASTALGWRKGSEDGYTIAWSGRDGARASGLNLQRLERVAIPPGERLQQDVTQRDGWTLERARQAGEGHLVLSRTGQAPVRLAVINDPVLSFTLPAAGEVSWVAWTSRDGLHLSDPVTRKNGLFFLPGGRAMLSVASAPDGKYLLAYSARGLYHVYRPDQKEPLLTVFASGPDWVVWTEEGYYAATPGGEKLIGWRVNNGPNKLATFYPAERFRKTLYRPDVIKLVLDKGSVPSALAAANAARNSEGETVAEGTADVGQLLPPRAALEILNKAALPNITLRARAEAAASGQPVVSLRLLVDGRPLPDGQGALDLKQGRAKAETTWGVSLPPGAHELKVLARSPDTGDTSPAVSVTVPAAGPAGAGRPSLYVIAVGIDKYPQKNLQLGCAVADAKGLADAFTKGCAGKDNLFVAVPPTTLLNEQAKRKAVLDALEEARKAVKPGDLLVFSFAGHGTRQGKQLYLLTVDADQNKLAKTALSGDDLRKALADVPCQVLLLLDACHSAAGVRAFSDEAARDMTDDETGVAVLCAALGSEEAGEENGHGLFTRAVLEALGRADRVPYDSHDGRQYVHHLGSFVLDEVRARSHDEQHPFLTLPYVTESFPIRRVAAAPAGGR